MLIKTNILNGITLSLPQDFKEGGDQLKNLAPSLHVAIHTGRYQKILITGIYLLTILACWLNALSIYLKLLLTGLVVYGWYLKSQTSRANIIYLSYTDTESWQLCENGNDYFPIEIKPTTVISNTLTVLHCNRANGDNTHKTVVIFKDAMSSNDYRRLIVCLKISGFGQA